MLSISVDDLLKLNNPYIIDVRSEQSYNNNHIPLAKNIPHDKLLEKPNKYISKNNRYYIYCQRGVTSLRVCQKLTSLGYSVTNVIGGYEEWMLNR